MRSRPVVALLLPALVLLGCVADDRIADAQGLPTFNGGLAMVALERQVAIGPRVPGTATHLEARDYLVEQFGVFADHVELQSFSITDDDREIPMHNVIATFGNATESPVMLCAHWDTRPFADRDPNPENRDKPIPGANDGASGVAVLIELARVFDIVAPPVPIVFVLFDGEDWGKSTANMFHGSRYYAQNITPARPRYAILLDMVGDADLSIPIEPTSRKAAPELMRDLWATAADMGVTQFSSRTGPALSDDHVLLIRAGIPAIDLIDFSYPPWHTLEDTPDKCSAESLEAVGSVLARYIYTLGG